MKTLADVVAEHVESVLHNVHTAASIMGSRGFPDPQDRTIYLLAAQDVLTATALALGLPADFGPAIATPAPRLPQPYTLEQPAMDATPQGVDALTRSERKIAEMIVAGMTSSAIAEKLVVEPCTVKSHRRGIAVKLGGSEREHLSKFPQLHQAKVEAEAPA